MKDIYNETQIAKILLMTFPKYRQMLKDEFGFESTCWRE